MQHGRPRRDRIPSKGGAELDATTAWRRWYCYLSRAGVTKSIKAQINRRKRREESLKLRRWL